MKKILAVLMALSMLLLSACNGDKQDKQASQGTSQITQGQSAEAENLEENEGPMMDNF